MAAALPAREHRRSSGQLGLEILHRQIMSPCRFYNGSSALTHTSARIISLPHVYTYVHWYTLMPDNVAVVDGKETEKISYDLGLGKSFRHVFDVLDRFVGRPRWMIPLDFCIFIVESFVLFLLAFCFFFCIVLLRICRETRCAWL